MERLQAVEHQRPPRLHQSSQAQVVPMAWICPSIQVVQGSIFGESIVVGRIQRRLKLWETTPNLPNSCSADRSFKCTLPGCRHSTVPPPTVLQSAICSKVYARITREVLILEGLRMNKIIGVTELQRRFKSVLDEVVKRGVPYILTRGSRAEAALLPYEDFVRYQEMQEKEILARFDLLRERMAEQNRQYSEEEVEADIRAVRKQGQRS